MKTFDDKGMVPLERVWAIALGAALMVLSCATLAAEGDEAIVRTEPSACVMPVGSEVARELAGLNYECMTLRQGGHVFVGTAGPVGAEAVLLIHGLGNNAHRDFARTLPELTDRYRVVTLDLPGFGASAPLSQGYSFESLSSVLA